MKNLLLTFKDDKTRDDFLRLLHDLTTRDTTAQMEGELIKATLETARLNPALKSDHERVAAIFVSGKKMVEGTLSNMRQRFQQEVDSHKATVEIKELREGIWTTIQARRLQRQ